MIEYGGSGKRPRERVMSVTTPAQATARIAAALPGAADLAPGLLQLVARLGGGEPARGLAALGAQPRFNALLPLAYRAAQLGLLSLDDELRARSAHLFYQSVASVERLQAELGAIAGRFAAAGLPLVVLKGSAYVFALYGEPGIRPPGDLDLLVPPERLDEATARLESEGYTLVGRSDRHGLRELAGPGRPAGKGNVDLHSRIGPWRSWTAPGYPLDLAALWRRARPLPLPGCPQPPLQLGPEDALLFTGFQAGQHGFDKFTSTLDLYAFARAGEVDQARLVSVLAEAGGHPFRVHLFWALELSRALHGAPIPPGWLAATRPSALRRAVLARWAAPERIAAGRLRVQSRAGYLLLARSPAAMAAMVARAVAYLVARALGGERER
jgi:hypothetical protein